MSKEAAAKFAAIDRRAASRTGGGAWDIWAWKGDEYLILESKQHKRGDTLRPGQVAWLEAAIDEGVSRFAIVEYSATRPVGVERAQATRRPAKPARPTPTTDLPSSLARALDDAARAAPADRIGFRDQVAAFGDIAVQPLAASVRDGTHSAFAIGTLERMARGGSASALAELKRLKPITKGTARSDIEDALRRVGATASAPHPQTERGSGWRASAFGPPAAVGPCDFLTGAGKACENMGRYERDGRWACSAHMRASVVWPSPGSL